MQDVYIVDAIRTPVGKAPNGLLHTTRPDDLLAHLLKALPQRVATFDPTCCEDVIIGCAMPEAEQGMNVARIAVLLADYPISVPAFTINRFCASGLESVAIAANRIASGSADVIVAGGVESMSMVPLGGNKCAMNPSIYHNPQVAIAYGMGVTAEEVAQRWQISKERQVTFAFDSHQKAVAAQDAGHFAEEIIPIDVCFRNFRQGSAVHDQQTVSEDQGPRRDTSIERMAKLRSPFAAKGSVTAATSSQISDGAGVVLLASEAAVRTHGFQPLARFCGYSVAGVPPEVMGIGPVEAIPQALAKTGLDLSAIDWIELNEAFASQSLAVIDQLQIAVERVNPQGGAIALGHPLGATGAIRLSTLVHGLHRTQQRYGMVTMCIGTGMGAAGIFERC